MTTFTTEDRINASPPHIVDSGASVMGKNAFELADSIDKYLDSILEEAIHPIEDVLNQSIAMLRQQQAEISLLQEYVCQLESGLDSSIKLNKAQAERQEK